MLGLQLILLGSLLFMIGLMAIELLDCLGVFGVPKSQLKEDEEDK